MRRKDREVTDRAEILDILERCQVLYLGLCDGNMPYVVPMNFGWRQNGGELTIYFHCALEGRKLDIIARNQKACFAADCGYKLVPAEEACGWGAIYASVMGEGEIAVLRDAEEKEEALSVIMRHYGFKGDMVFPQKATGAVHVLELTVSSISGKRRNV